MNLPKIFYFRRAGRSLFQNAILIVAQGEDHLAAKIYPGFLIDSSMEN
jgi:hypothetical protein